MHIPDKEEEHTADSWYLLQERKLAQCMFLGDCWCMATRTNQLLPFLGEALVPAALPKAPLPNAPNVQFTPYIQMSIYPNLQSRVTNLWCKGETYILMCWFSKLNDLHDCFRKKDFNDLHDCFNHKLTRNFVIESISISIHGEKKVQYIILFNFYFLTWYVLLWRYSWTQLLYYTIF